MEIVVADQMRTALLRTLGSVLEPARVAPGCLSARLFSDLDKRKGLLLVEEWETRDQFERNLDTAKLKSLGIALKDVATFLESRGIFAAAYTEDEVRQAQAALPRRVP